MNKSIVTCVSHIRTVQTKLLCHHMYSKYIWYIFSVYSNPFLKQLHYLLIHKGILVSYLGILFTWMDPRYSHAQHSLSSSDFKIIINITNPPTSFVNILSSFVVIPSWKNSQVVRPCLFSTNYHCSSQYLYWTIFFCWIMFSVWRKMWWYCFLQNKQSSIFLVCWNVHCSISHVKSRCFTKRCWNIYHW